MSERMSRVVVVDSRAKVGRDNVDGPIKPVIGYTHTRLVYEEPIINLMAEPSYQATKLHYISIDQSSAMIPVSSYTKKACSLTL